MSRYDTYKDGLLVDKESLKEFKKKYDKNIVTSAETTYGSNKDTDIVSIKALYELTGGITFGQNADGKYGYSIGNRGTIIPFGSTGFDGFQGLIWSCGYVDTSQSYTTPPGRTVLTNQTDILEATIWTNRWNQSYTAFKVKEGSRIKFKSYSAYGEGNNSLISNTFTVYDSRTMTTMETYKKLNDVTLNCEGYELFVMTDPLKCSKTLDDQEKMKFYGGWFIEILAVNSDYIYKPAYVFSTSIHGNGNAWDFHQSTGYKSSRYTASELVKGTKGYAVCNGGWTSGGEVLMYISNTSGSNHYDRGIIKEIKLDDTVSVSGMYSNSEETYGNLLIFTMPESEMEDKIPTTLKAFGLYDHFCYNPDGSTSRGRSAKYTVEGIPEGSNGFVITVGGISASVNDIAISNGKAKIIKNGDTIKISLNTRVDSSNQGWAYAFYI